jgi:hypothetical protein
MILTEGMMNVSQSQALKTSPSHHPPRHLRPVKSQARPAPVEADSAGRYIVYQWKDQLDADSHWLKKAFFWLVYRPFIHFCRFKLRLPTFNGECEDGRLCWLEFQGWVSERWQAEQVAETRNWGYSLLPVGAMLPPQTSIKATDHNYPLADEKTQENYRKNGKPTIEVSRLDIVKLAGKIAQTDPLVENFHHSKAT